MAKEKCSITESTLSYHSYPKLTITSHYIISSTHFDRSSNQMITWLLHQVGSVIFIHKLFHNYWIFPLQEERVLFHYNGHGVPRATANGEIWVFNKVRRCFVYFNSLICFVFLKQKCCWINHLPASPMPLPNVKSWSYSFVPKCMNYVL